MKSQKKAASSAILRQKAEALMKKKTQKLGLPLTDIDALKLVHELEVYQIELELQNEELYRAKVRESQLATEKYIELYDFAPTGYFTLSMDGHIVDLNLCGAQMLGAVRSQLKNSPFAFYVSIESRPKFNYFLQDLFVSKEKKTCEISLSYNGNIPIYVHLTGILSDNGAQCLVTAVDITDLKFREDEREELTSLIMLINSTKDLRKSMSELTSSLQIWSGCEAVGIRLRKGDDYPYYESHGFPPTFIEGEKYLCGYDKAGEIQRESNGNVMLKCMCGNVLCKRFDPSKPFFTPTGTFWTNSTSKLLASTVAADRQSYICNQCNGAGYESVALIPLCNGQHIIGLVQFNDHHSNHFTPMLISHLERMVDNLAIVLSQHLAEEALQKSEEKYRFLFANNPQPMWIYDIETLKFLEVNDAAIKHYGYSEAEFLSMSLRNIRPEEDLPALLKFLEHIGNGYSPPVEWRHIKKNGEVIYVEVTSHPVVSNGKKARHVLVHDITKAKKAEEELRSSEQRFSNLHAMFRLLADNTTDFLWAKDINGKFIFTNKTLCDRILMASDVDEPIGKTDLFFAKRERNTHPDNPEWYTFGETCVNSDKITLTEGKPRQFDELGNIRGKFLYLDVHKAPIVDDHRKVIGVVGTARDVTHQRQLEDEKTKAVEALQKSEENLKRTNDEKDAFFSIIAHDLRSPFNGFLGLTELMAEGMSRLSAEELQKLATVMRNSATNLFQLIGNLLEWARMQRGLTPFAPVSFLLISKISEIREKMLNISEKKEISIDYDIPEQLMVFADLNMFGVIVCNLVTNAVKFTHKGGKISVSAKSVSENAIEVSIRDTGIGMSQDVIENLFRLDVKTSRKGTDGESCTGLGLIICKDYIEKHGGRLWIESEEGKGSHFKFTLPELN